MRDVREGKGRFDLLPTRAIRQVAQHFEGGAKKYGDRNWEKGQPLSRYLDSAMRHGFAAMEGQADENHAAAAAWNWLCFIETRARIAAGLLPAELDDLPKSAQLPVVGNTAGSLNGACVLVGDQLGVPANVP
ncbi:MAG: DUF5664 domain-containing protein [Acidobacteria bacterium]|nr:DUF5664 domain-containing protein [Acidobacteriota bacterium]